MPHQISSKSEVRCIKISYNFEHNEYSDKMAYTRSADPDQTTPERAVWSASTLSAIVVRILRNNCIKNKFWSASMKKSVRIFRTFIINMFM